jgi:hypothetical protein
MNLNKETLIKDLEESVNRLEQARSNIIELHDSRNAHLESIEAFAEVSAEIDGIGAALLIDETRIDELAQVLGEEIDHLRELIEKIDGAD